jgi:hypothetical protein
MQMLLSCAQTVVASCAVDTQAPCVRTLRPCNTDKLDGALSNAGLEELSVHDCAFMTHQAMAGIARCTSLTSLCIEETCTVATGPRVRSLASRCACFMMECMRMPACAARTIAHAKEGLADLVLMPSVAPHASCSRQWVLVSNACRSSTTLPNRRAATATVTTICWCPQS